ncbi:MAG: hypothetical protein WBB62_12185, partial [Rhodococcus sp. (in: high G+C Gram-positive bacteria)]
LIGTLNDDTPRGHRHAQRRSTTTSIPDPTYITDTVDAATHALLRGTMRWLELGGHDEKMIGAVAPEIFAKMPKTSDDLGS